MVVLERVFAVLSLGGVDELMQQQASSEGYDDVVAYR